MILQLSELEVFFRFKTSECKLPRYVQHRNGRAKSQQDSTEANADEVQVVPMRPKVMSQCGFQKLNKESSYLRTIVFSFQKLVLQYSSIRTR